jgi:hypothetical protein
MIEPSPGSPLAPDPVAASPPHPAVAATVVTDNTSSANQVRALITEAS